VRVRDGESGEEFAAGASVVINATGAFTDSLRRMADPRTTPMIAPSQGIHLVFDSSFLPGRSAIMVPHTSDGRVMFAIPWHGHTLVGTTDTPIETSELEPRAQDQEIEFILETASLYLAKPPTRGDVLSVFAGIRPLVKMGGGKNTAALSRDHTIHIDDSGLVSVAGGKWTTYRNMAEDCVNQGAMLARLPERDCVTRTLPIHGFHNDAEKFGELAHYGSDAQGIVDLMRQDATLSRTLHDDLPYVAAEVVWAVRNEMARTVDDVLARRTRALYLNARAAMAMAPDVARFMATELGCDHAWRTAQVNAFTGIAQRYIVA
jgi:glycerol-3-phosphate dehydrogenase